MSSHDDYNLSGRGPIRLKETRQDKAERLYRKEQRRYRREQERISRANGYAVSPPRTGRAESITPPRNPAPGLSRNESGEQQGGYRWMGGQARAAMDRAEEQERMAWMAQEELSRENPFATMDRDAVFDVHVPPRYRRSASNAGPSRRRDATREVKFDGGPVPDMSGMDEEEYAEWVRNGMYRLRNRAELERQEKIRKERVERERIMEEAKETARRVEKRRIDKLKKEKGKAEEDKKRAQRDRYRARWDSIGDVGGEIEEAELAFADIPWPIYSSRQVRVDDLEQEAVRTFFEAIAGDRGSGDDELRKILREAIRAFHPDRFFSRILPRVKARDQELVKEGVEKCSRIINALAAKS
ncbi:hypothetical protein BD324DRAFT_629364 [Kockovaella imperatae]|uniref:Uncharacterized protein n=1 Tax=Kockovaella imperatae TaxID=4999 RepID=A0A1Y1UCV8_9TREE|nr:hypothetical protein BD324DRAFT_629364 [Kockovaella imperatae]ORX35878.1 hypothetical protein BD324DRAFT_629364 [Kockovaella imperatae]